MPAMTSTERIFLRLERPGYPFDITGVVLLEPSAEGPLPFEQVRALLNQRYHRVSPMTRVIAPAALGIGDERWAQATEIDIDEHVRARTVPKPGDTRALLQTVLDLTKEPLDRSRPLWQVWYLTGMADGSAALLIRTHHAMLDGVGLMNLNRVLFDAEPTPVDVAEHPPPLAPRARASTARRVLFEVPDRVVAQVGTTARLAGYVRGALPEIVVRLPTRVVQGAAAQVGARLLKRPVSEDAQTVLLPELPGYIPSPTNHPPVTRFNRHVDDPSKAMAVTSVALSDVRQVRAAFPDVTVNDILLALVTGSLRDYLAAHDDLPSVPMRTTCPVNLRTTDQAARQNNEFTTMWIDLPVHVADPEERLRAVSAYATAAKKSLRESQASWDALADVGDLLLPGVVTAVMAFAGTRAFGVFPPTQNLTMSTVIQSTEPLYLGTRRISHVFARTIVCPPIHLFVNAITYAEHVDFSITTVRELCPDPQVLADGLRAELARLLERASTGRAARPADAGPGRAASRPVKRRPPRGASQAAGNA